MNPFTLNTSKPWPRFLALVSLSLASLAYSQEPTQNASQADFNGDGLISDAELKRYSKQASNKEVKRDISETGENKLPNFLVIVVDDLGYADIGANNPNCFYETPYIDAFATSAMRFTDGYAANPVCSPTRYSLITGKYPSRVDATNFFSGKKAGKFRPAPLVDNMPLEEITLPQMLKKKDYATFFAGKWHLGESEAYYPHKRGFDINIGGYQTS